MSPSNSTTPIGFPLDLTELMARERGLTVDNARLREAAWSSNANAPAPRRNPPSSAPSTSPPKPHRVHRLRRRRLVEATVLEIHPQEDALFVITDKTVFYAEMGGQVGDTGTHRSPDADQYPSHRHPTNRQGPRPHHLQLSISTLNSQPRSATKSRSSSTPPAAARSKRTTPSPTCSTGRCTKSFPQTPRRKVPPSMKTACASTSTAPPSRPSKSPTMEELVNGAIKARTLRFLDRSATRRHQGPRRHHAVLRRQIRRHRPRRPDRRRA